MDNIETIPLPEGITLMDPKKRRLLAAEGYSELGLFDEAQRELEEHAEILREEWEAMPEAQKRLSRPISEIMGWTEQPTA